MSNAYATPYDAAYADVALLAFSRQHDCGYDAHLVDGGIRVGTEVRHADGSWTREHTVCADMRSLRLWAGY
jgi:hypothetical protein